MAARVTVDRAALHRMLSGLGGPGYSLLADKAQRVATWARFLSADNGSISRGIVVRPAGTGTIKVVSTNPHTLLVHNGSRPHKIRARRAGKYLRFEVNGRIVYAREVNHPGYRGNPFLTDALKQVW